MNVVSDGIYHMLIIYIVFSAVGILLKERHVYIIIAG